MMSYLKYQMFYVSFRKCFYSCVLCFLISFGFSLLPFHLHSQNLVYNPGFESDSGAVIGDYSQFRAGTTLVDGWYLTTDATSDYYNSHQSTIKGHPIPKARTGQGRMAMVWSNYRDMPYREYVTGKLISPLVKNKKYKVSFYICRYKYSQWSPLQIGAYFSKDSMIQKNYWGKISVEPQVQVNDYTVLEDRYYWHKVEQVFVADGDEKFITIGNFKKTINDVTQPAIKVSNKFTIVATKAYAYVFVDDFSVEEYVEEENPIKKSKLYVYLIDASSSMKNDKKYEKLSSGIKKSITELPIDAFYSFSVFSSQTTNVLKPTKVILNDFCNVLDTLRLGGATQANQALDYTYNQISEWKDYDVELIMCSDGKFNLTNETIDKIKLANNPFNLIQIGGSKSKELEEIINFTNGKYVLTDTKNIKEDIQNLSISVSNQMEEVQYTKMIRKKVAIKWTLAILIPVLLVGLML